MSQDPYLMPGTMNRMIEKLYRTEYCRMCRELKDEEGNCRCAEYEAAWEVEDER